MTKKTESDNVENATETEQATDNGDDSLETILESMDESEEPTNETNEPSDQDTETEVEDVESDEEPVITLGTGETVTQSELENGYLRQSDYTKKTTDLSNQMKATQELYAQYQQNQNALNEQYAMVADFFANSIPQEPDIGLLYEDPQLYNQQKGLRDAAISEYNAFTQQAEQQLYQQQLINDQEMQRVKLEQDKILLEQMPELKEPGKMASFRTANLNTAKDFGFTEDEVNSMIDGRVARVLHYARLGKQAETNRVNAQRRISNKTAKPQKGQQGKNAPVETDANKYKLWQRLSETGSVEDAVALMAES